MMYFLPPSWLFRVVFKSLFFHFVLTLFFPNLNALIYISTYDEPGHSIGFRTPKLWQIIIQTFLPGNFIKHKSIISEEFKEIYI